MIEDFMEKFTVNPAMLYESPISEMQAKIKNIIREQKEEREKDFMCQLSVQMGYEIDKDELVKALMYDRKQYEKGFSDAEKHFRAVARWEYYEDGDERFPYKCGRCGCPSLSTAHRFCSSCGARMEPINIDNPRRERA